METIERILGHEIPVLPEPFLPESELRPLTEADYQRLFEEFCAAPISTLPPEFWTETTTDKPVSITPAKETQAATPQRPRHHHLTDQEKYISAHEAAPEDAHHSGQLQLHIRQSDPLRQRTRLQSPYREVGDSA